METEALILVRNDAALSVSPNGLGERMKADALEKSALIGRVSNAAEQAEAVEAQKAIKTVLKATEDSRKAVKEPILDYGRAIDTAAKTFAEDLKKEEMRLAKLVGDFQQLELAKTRAAEAARLAELAEIERRKQEEIANAASHDEIDAIHARANEEVAAVPVRQPVKVAGQTVTEEWEFEVTDAQTLARAYPGCVELVPRRSEIKALLKAGVTPPGVTARKVIKAGVRLGRETAMVTAG